MNAESSDFTEPKKKTLAVKTDSFIARGERYEGLLSLDSANEFDFLPSRDVIVVLYDPAAPRTNTVYVP